MAAEQTPGQRARQQLIDSRYAQILEAVRQDGATSIAHLQEKCKCTYNGALHFLLRMEKEGVIGPADEGGTRPLLKP